MPSTDRRLELKAKDIDGSDRLTAGCVCQWVNTGVLPDRLKYAIVQPSFKKGNKQDIFNYRPISLLTSFSKMTAKLIY